MTNRPRDPKECLRWLLTFAQQPHSDFYPQSPKPKRGRLKELPQPDPEPSVMAAAQEGIEHFIVAARPRMSFGPREVKPLAGAHLRDLYSQTRYGLSEAAAGGSWIVPATNLSGSFRLAAGRGWLAYDGDTRDQFLLTCMDLMRREGKLVTKCARKGCGTLFLRSRRARYCGKACSRLAEAEQARSRRSTSDPDRKRQQREQRRRHYETWLAKHGYSKARIRALHRRWLDKQKSQLESESEAR